MSHTTDSVDALFLFACRTLGLRKRDRRARTVLLLTARMNGEIAFLARHFLWELDQTRRVSSQAGLGAEPTRLAAAKAKPDPRHYIQTSTKEKL